ncbi:MAG: DUF3800 domain-containing protein [Candidatus Methanomethylophilaceae archaeon]|nr:DUF3800 domain-containing protein [Candidatus Methanomethylophilaceae archaeon]
MTSTVSLDESGNLGSQDRYFIMSALIVRRTRDLSKAFKVLDEMGASRKSKKGAAIEVKFSNSYPHERIKILKSLSDCSISIVYVVIDKKKSPSYKDIRNCNLYKAAVGEILPLIGKMLCTKDVSLNFDENRCIDMKNLLELVAETVPDLNVKSVRKVNSSSDKAVQLVDFISGLIREKYEHGDDKYMALIEDGISIAHET